MFELMQSIVRDDAKFAKTMVALAVVFFLAFAAAVSATLFL
jgi:hypothetical protein